MGKDDESELTPAEKLTEAKIALARLEAKQYKEELKAWQEEHNCTGGVLFEQKCWIDRFEQLEGEVDRFLSYYKPNPPHPVIRVKPERRRISETIYRIDLIANDFTIHLGHVEARFSGSEESGQQWAIVEVVCYPGTPMYEELCKPARELLESLSDHLQRHYASDDPGKQKAIEDSGHYTYPQEKRWQIVQEYRQARSRGEITNMEAWAGVRGITAKTLRKYIKEFSTEV